MKGSKMKHLFFTVIGFLFASCSNEVSRDEFVKYMNAPENGLVKTKAVGDVQVSLQLVPSQFLAYNEMDASFQASLDSVNKLYNESYNFMLSLSNTKNNEEKDIMYKELGGIEEFRRRSEMMNFNLDNYCWVNTPSGEIHPVLSNMENTYGLSKARKIHFVFGKKSEQVDLTQFDELKISFDDPLFGTGKTNFIFNKSDLDKIPRLVVH